MKLDEKFVVEGLELIAHSAPKEPGFEGYEALKYKTPSGSEFVIAKDVMSCQICKYGAFFPGFVNFGTIERAVDYLRQHTSDAVRFFDEVEKLERKRKAKLN